MDRAKLDVALVQRLRYRLTLRAGVREVQPLRYTFRGYESSRKKVSLLLIVAFQANPVTGMNHGFKKHLHISGSNQLAFAWALPASSRALRSLVCVCHSAISLKPPS